MRVKLTYRSRSSSYTDDRTGERVLKAVRHTSTHERVGERLGRMIQILLLR